MKRFILIITLLVCLLPSSMALAEGDVAILSPQNGAGVKGRVVVTGYIKASNYSGYELDFMDEGNSAPGWYPVDNGTKVAEDGSLGIWDTTAISDGNYSLRITVKLNDGSTSSATVSGIRVRNYSPMETETPAPAGEQKIAPTAVPTSLLPAGQTTHQIVRNPAEVTTGQFSGTLILGAILGLAIGFILVIVFRRQKSG